MSPSLWSVFAIIFIAAPLGLDYTARLLTNVVATVRSTNKPDRLRNRKQRHAMRWFVPPVVTAVVVSAWFSPWPIRSRFTASLPALEKAVSDIQALTPPSRAPSWIGLYHVKRINDEGGGRIGFVTGYGWWDPVGLLYDPTDSARSGMTVRLAPRWYATEF